MMVTTTLTISLAVLMDKDPEEAGRTLSVGRLAVSRVPLCLLVNEVWLPEQFLRRW